MSSFNEFYEEYENKHPSRCIIIISENSFRCLLILIFVFSTPIALVVPNAAVDWPYPVVAAEFDALGAHINCYFDATSGYKAVVGIVKFTGSLDGVYVKLTIGERGTLQGGKEHFSMIGDYNDIYLTSDNITHTQGIGFDVPQEGSFEVYVTLDFSWLDYEGNVESDTVYLRREYDRSVGNGHGPLLALLALAVLVTGGVAVYITIDHFSKKRKRRGRTEACGQRREKREIDKSIERLIASFVEVGGKWKTVSLDRRTEKLSRTGEISLLLEEKEKLQAVLEKLEIEEQSLVDVVERINASSCRVRNNLAYKLIAKYLEKASKRQPTEDRKRMNEISRSIQTRDWSELTTVDTIEWLTRICWDYSQTQNKKKPLKFDFGKANDELVNAVRAFQELNRELKERRGSTTRQIIRKYQSTKSEKGQTLEKLTTANDQLKAISGASQEELNAYRERCVKKRKEVATLRKKMLREKQEVDINVFNQRETDLRKIDKLLKGELDLITRYSNDRWLNMDNPRIP